MKKLSLLICLSALVMASFAQLPNGTYAPAFTGYEIDKTNGNIISSNPIVLYDLTDAGYAVYMDVFATWCGPCWSYHTGGYLESLYSQYGPEGTNQVRVMGVEGDQGNYASLSGTGGSTQGNWLNGVEYPIIPTNMAPNSTSFGSNYAIAYFPTLYMVCPKSRLIYEIGTNDGYHYYSASELYSLSNSVCPQFDFSLANNAFLHDKRSLDVAYCSYTPTVELENVGTATMTSATLMVNCEGQTYTCNWTGNLESYNKTTITLPQIVLVADGDYSYTVTVSQVNGVNDADATKNTVTGQFKFYVNPSPAEINEDFTSGIPSEWSNPDGMLSVRNAGSEHGKAVRFKAFQDAYGEIAELYLPIRDLSGIAAPVLNFDLAHKRRSGYSESLTVKYSTNCGATWNNLYKKQGSALATVSGDGTTSFTPNNTSWRNENVDLSSISDRSNLILKFEFKSGYGNNVWIDNVKVSGTTGIEEIANGVKIYPNPATDMINITTTDNVQRVEIFNMQGQLVKAENGAVNHISVKDLANGLYTLKLTTDNGTSMHKIIKK